MSATGGGRRWRWAGALALLVAVAAGVVLAVGLERVLLFVGFDDADSAGPERGVTLNEVAQHPEPLLGHRVRISGDIEEVLGCRALVLGDAQTVLHDEVLVVADMPLVRSACTEGGADVAEGDGLEVNGVVRRSVPQALEGRLLVDREELRDDHGTVVVAHRVHPSPPPPSGEGDTEGPWESAGRDRRLTLLELVSAPERYLGRRVTLSAEIERTLGPRAFLFSDDRLLVISRRARPGLFAEATAIVTGTVRALSPAEVERRFGVKLAEDGREAAREHPVIVLERARLTR